MIEVSRSQARIASLPLRLRRRLLRTGWNLRRLSGRLETFAFAPALQTTMRLSRAEAARIDAEAVFSDELVALEWLAMLYRRQADLAADFRRVRVTDEGLIARVAASGKPVILAPVHMGCYALPFAGLIRDHFRDRRMLILRAREDLPVDTLVMERIREIGIDMRFLNVRNKQDYIDAIRFARKGSIIVTFVDLPASYGVAVDTTLFGRPIRLGMGIDGLARLTEATVLPLAVTSDANGDVLHVGQPFEVADNTPATRRRVTEIVRRHIETSVALAPPQWFMWPRLDEFLHDDPESGADV